MQLVSIHLTACTRPTKTCCIFPARAFSSMQRSMLGCEHFHLERFAFMSTLANPRKNRLLRKVSADEAARWIVQRSYTPKAIAPSDVLYDLYCPKCRLVALDNCPAEKSMIAVTLECPHCQQLVAVREVFFGHLQVLGGPRDTEQMDPWPKFFRYLESIRTQSIPASGLHILAYTRELLEYVDIKEDFKTTNLLGNWTLHTKIQQSSPGFELLLRVNTALAALDANAHDADVAKAVTQQLSLAQFREELLILSRIDGLPMPFLDSWLQWNVLLASIFDELHGKPLKFPDGPESSWTGRSASTAKRMYASSQNAIEQKTGDKRKVIRQLRFEIPRTTNALPHERRGSLHWICTTDAGEQIEGAFTAFDAFDRSQFSTD
jgi:hypothetical protein